MQVADMATIILLPSRRRTLPRRLLNDGWWLEPDPPRRSVVAFPAPRPPEPKSARKRKASHLTLIISRE
jgi:hypothetical protein